MIKTLKIMENFFKIFKNIPNLFSKTTKNDAVEEITSNNLEYTDLNNLLYFIDILKLKCLNKDNNQVIIRENLHGTQETILENEKLIIIFLHLHLLIINH